jgi:Domain of unknown function (DUF4286)
MPHICTMLLYNVTLTVDRDITTSWLQWMTDTHIPDVMSTGMFISYRFSRLIGHDHSDSEIFSVQYLTKDMAHLTRYHNEFAPELQRSHRERYGDKVAVFRTLMQIIEHNDKL